MLEEGFKTAPADIEELNSTNKNAWHKITLYEGHNQQIRKMFDAIGHSVVKLKRVAIGSISDPYLAVGASRPLTGEEVTGIGNSLQPAASRPPKLRPQSAPKAKRGARPSGRGPGL